MFKAYDELISCVKNRRIQVIDFKIVDLKGRWRHLTIPVERLSPELLEKGIGFDGSSYGFLTVERSDMVFIPDISSAFIDPVIDTPAISMIGDIYMLTGNGRERYQNDPRYIAEKAEKFLKDSGISDCCLLGPEFEFYVLDNVEYRVDTNHVEARLDSAQAGWNASRSPYDAPGNNKGYKVMAHGGYHVDLPYDNSYELRNKVVRALEDIGIPVKYHHAENGGPGQTEIEVEFSTPKDIADRTQKLKYVLKNLAVKNGKTVTFMPKPFFGESGSGMHVHVQMFNGGKPIFYNAKGYSNLSETALWAISGILEHSAAIAAFACPSTNSYKRLVPGYEAPVTICFGEANRTSVIRIPGYAQKPEDKRFEFRPSDATSNPYLCYSVLIMAAIDGIQKKSDPSEQGFGPYDRNMYYLSDEEKKTIGSLPKSLDEAADALEKDCRFLLNGGVFGEEIIKSQLARIRGEARELSLIPHPLEFKMYYDA